MFTYCGQYLGQGKGPRECALSSNVLTSCINQLYIKHSDFKKGPGVTYIWEGTFHC